MSGRRRGRGEGSVRQLASGSWQAILPGRARGGRTKTFATKAEALHWLRSRADTKATTAGTLGDWLTEWLTLIKPDVRAKTFKHDSYRVNLYLIPRLGSVRMRDLDGVRIKRMLADMATDGRSDSERQKAGAVLRKALNAAVSLGRLAVSPMAGIRLPTPRRPERRILTADQLRQFVGVADARGYGHVFRVWADAGLRPQEMFPLRWEDFDLSAGTVTISRALDAESRTIEETKTRRGRRTIDLAASTVAALRAVPERAGLILPDREGGMWWPGNFRRDVLKPIGQTAGVPWVYAYCFRHSMCALLLSAGVNILVISRRLGHEDISTTLRSYGHLMPDDQKTAAAVMDRIMG